MHKSGSGKDGFDLNSVLEEVRRQNLKVTEPRKAILKILVEHHGPFSVEQIYKKIKKNLCDLVTIYRCLSSLEHARIVKRCEFGDGTARFELAHKGDHHHHVICTSCKKVEVLSDCKLGNLDRFAQKKGFSNISHSLEFFGICADCN